MIKGGRVVGGPLAASSSSHRQAFLPIEPEQPLLVHAHAFSFQQDAQAPVAEPAALSRQAAQALAHLHVALFRLATHRLRIDLNQPAGALLGEAALRHQAKHGRSARCRPDQFFPRRSFNASGPETLAFFQELSRAIGPSLAKGFDRSIAVIGQGVSSVGVTPFVPKPLTSGAKAAGRFGKQDFVYLPGQDVYRCPAGALLPHHMTTVERGMTLHRYWDRASCTGCRLKPQCTPSIERRITRWEHESVIDALQARMDLAPRAMRTRRRLIEHPFGTIKAWMGHTHFLMKRLPNVKTEISLHILAYNMKRVIAVLGTKPLMEAIRA